MADLKQQTKLCKVCGFEFHNRKKWESRGLWEKIVYCSKKCRKQYKLANTPQKIIKAETLSNKYRAIK